MAGESADREGETARACSLVDVIYQRAEGSRDPRLGNSDEDLLGALEEAASETSQLIAGKADTWRPTNDEGETT